MEPQKASSGRIVHFYQPVEHAQDKFEGPFAAIVTDVHDEQGQFVNLVWFPKFAIATKVQGSVWQKDHPNRKGAYWEWPPRV